MIIEMSLDHYDRFSEICEASRPEYEILRNGMVVRRPKDGQHERIMEISCKMPDAKLLLGFAYEVYRPAIPDIEKAIRLAREK